MTLASDSDSIQPLLERIEKDLSDIKARLDSADEDRQGIRKDIEQFREDVKKTDEKFTVYQQANQSVVNLAFGLIVTAVVAIIVTAFK